MTEPAAHEHAHTADPWTAFITQDVLPYWGVGIGIAILLLVVLRVVVPAEQRSRIRVPLVLLIVAVVLYAIHMFLPHEKDNTSVASNVHALLDLAALTCLLFALGRSVYLLLLHGVIERKARAKGQKSLPGIFRDLIQVGIYAFVAFVVLRSAGVELASLLTTSALLSVVVGFALQDTLSNVFAGLAIQTQQPFDVGDWIQFDDDPDHIGEVVEINWRATRILTINRVEVIVPNATLAKAAIRNYSRPSPVVRRAVTISAPYDVPPARVHGLFLDAVRHVDGVRAAPPPDVQTIEFRDSGIEYRVRYYIEDYNQREIIDSRVRDRLWYSLRRAAIGIPFPQLSVTMLSPSPSAHDELHEVKGALSAVPLFSPLPEELLHDLALQTERRLYAAGEIVIEQGDPGAELFVVERGKVNVLVQRGKKSERVASLDKGQFFGEMSLLTGEARRATVRTDGEVALLVVSKDALSPILAASPDLANEISGVLAAREMELGRHSESTAHESVADRQHVLLARIRTFFSI